MAIGGYETPIMYGRTQIFDPTMAAMVLDVNKRYGDALKDERDNAIKNLTTFSNTFGDFSSPFARDMERYGEMVGNVQRVINDAYAHGIDLTRSPEGRLLISQMTNSINPGEYNNMRANAKLGYAYLDAIEKAKAKNEFDQNFENWSLMNSGLGKFEDFSSAGGKIWNRSAPYVYQDLNQYAGHIFDKMEDSFIETGKDHYDYYGVSREAREKALTQHLSGLLNSELGQYHYQNSKAAYENILGRPLSDEEAMKYWQRDILDSTQEYEHRNRKLNEIWKLNQENAARRASGGGKEPKAPIAYDSAEGLFYRGLIVSGGTSHYADVEKAVEDGRDNIVNRQIELLKQAQSNKYGTDQTKKYILDNLSIEEAPSNFARYAQVNADGDGIFAIDSDAAERLFDDDSVVSHMYGVTYKSNGKQYRKYTDRSNLVGKVGKAKKKVTTGFVQDANGDYSIRQFWEVEVGHMDGDTFETEKVMRYDLPTSRSITHNVPGYTKYKRMNQADKNVIIRPSIKERPTTMGLKNTGSQKVNAFEQTPSPMGFWGTSNNEAFEER